MRMQFMQVGLDIGLWARTEEAGIFFVEAISVSSCLRLHEELRPHPIAVNTSKAIKPKKIKCIPNILIIKVYQIFKLRAQGLLSFSKKLMRKGLYLFAQCTYCTSDFKYYGTGTHVSFTKNIISVPSFNQNISLIPFESK